jgi:ribose-phosphate pyrophosphokinase
MDYSVKQTILYTEGHVMPKLEKIVETIPIGPLGIIALESSKTLGNKVNDYLVYWRDLRESEHKGTLAFTGYQRDNYLINACCPRFGTGEAKGQIKETVRGYDLYLLVDVTNYSLTYTVRGHDNHMSPDDHYQDIKRIIAAAGGKARRITVIMPYLYEGRQHRRSSRESLDCALALQELTSMGVESIITFDAHDPRVQNAIPLNSLETVQPTYQFIKAILKNVPDIKMDSDHMMVISPDEGGMGRAVYFANVLGLDMGMFYKRRDYTKIIHGRNPIVAHEFLGPDIEGKDIMIIDDMISSGESMLDVATELKRRKANRIFVVCTFGLFTGGLDKFDEAYEQGIIYRLLTTNLTYQTPDLLTKPYYINVDMSKYIALIIDTLNHDKSISGLLNPVERINNILEKYNQVKKK